MGSYLGQNFLKNKDKIKEIVDALKLKGDVVVEIGPGHGELTKEIDDRGKEKVKSIIAIEKDKELAKELKEKFIGNENFEIIEGDALKILPDLSKKLKAKNYKLIGNIPYYITGFLLRTLSELENKPELIVLMVQKEVAERVAAKPPKNNLLAASVQIWADLEIISFVPKKDFDPVPEVDSAVIKLKPTTYNQPARKIHSGGQPTAEEKEKYYKFIKILFKQPRKTILNNLRPTTGDQQLIKEKLELLKISPNDRPQDLSLEQIVKLFKIFNDLI